MEYQLELANKTIEELKLKFIEAEQQAVNKESNKISKFELQEKQLERLNEEIAQLHIKQEQLEHDVRQKDEQIYNCESYITRMESQLKEQYYQIDDLNDYIRHLEQKLINFDNENVDLIKQNQTLQLEMDYQKKQTQSQLNQIKAEYDMKIIQHQERLIQLSRTPNKENIAFSQNTSFIDQGKESRTSKQSTSDQLFELQNELNKNIKLLNQKLKTYK